MDNQYGFLRQYFAETNRETFTTKELYEVFSVFAPLMTKEQERQIAEAILNNRKTNKVCPKK